MIFASLCGTLCYADPILDNDNRKWEEELQKEKKKQTKKQNHWFVLKEI